MSSKEDSFDIVIDEVGQLLIDLESSRKRFERWQSKEFRNFCSSSQDLRDLYTVIQSCFNLIAESAKHFISYFVELKENSKSNDVLDKYYRMNIPNLKKNIEMVENYVEMYLSKHTQVVRQQYVETRFNINYLN